MAGSKFDFAREYDLPPEIVWDALIDPILVAGWLAHASIEACLGGRYDLCWATRGDSRVTEGEIVTMVTATALSIRTSDCGRFDFVLNRIDGGSRGSSTALGLSITVDTEPRFAGTTRAYWLSNLDQLGELLRGHPVDWENWQTERGPIWEEYRRSASASGI